MNFNDPISNFKMSYGVLMQLGDKGVQLIEQDQAVLAPYGVDAAFKTTLTNQTLQLKDYPTDEELRGAEADATAIKNASAETNRTAIRTVMVKVAANFPNGSPKYNRFGTKGLSDMNDPDLAKCGLRVVRMLNEFLGDMPNFTQAEIDAFEIIAKKFDSDYDEQQYVGRAHIAGTHERLIIGNKLYGKIVTLFDFGKDYWSSRNAARYKDYVIYDTPSGGPELSGQTGSVYGTVMDKTTLQPVGGGMVSFEFVDSPFAIDPATGKYQGANVPIESSYAFCMAPGHKLLKTDVHVVADQNTKIDILMQPGS